MQSNESYELLYKLSIPANFNEKFFTLNLFLIDPFKNERFGDPFISIIEIFSDKFAIEKSIVINDDS